MKRKLAWVILTVLVLLTAAGCGAGMSNSAGIEMPGAQSDSASSPARGEAGFTGDIAYDEEYAEDDAYVTDAEDFELEPDEDTVIEPGGDIVPESLNTETRKIIYSVDLSLQTTEFDNGVAQIQGLAESFGGFIQDSYVVGTDLYDKYVNRHASYTLRIPSEKLDEFIQQTGDIFHIVSQSKNSSDITGQYYDVTARLASLRVQEERLMAMLEGATELQYMLEVERELADVLYEIESMTSSLNRMDASVDYSTVTIYLQEVSLIEDDKPVVAPITFSERVSETFGDSWDGFIAFCQGFVLFLIALVPFLPVFAVIAVVVILIVRAQRKRRAAYVPPDRPPHVFPLDQPVREKEQNQKNGGETDNGNDKQDPEE